MTRAAFATLLLVASAVPAMAGDQDFQMVNRTGYQIDEVYVGASSSSSWGSDVMGSDSLSDGERVNITFPNRTRTCNFDIKVKYHDGDQATWTNIDLCKVSKVSLYWRNGTTRAVTE